MHQILTHWNIFRTNLRTHACVAYIKIDFLNTFTKLYVKINVIKLIVDESILYNNNIYKTLEASIKLATYSLKVKATSQTSLISRKSRNIDKL